MIERELEGCPRQSRRTAVTLCDNVRLAVSWGFLWQCLTLRLMGATWIDVLPIGANTAKEYCRSERLGKLLAPAGQTN